MIEPRIAAVSPVGAVGLQQQHRRGAVRILLAGETGELDHQVGLVDDTGEEVLGRFVTRVNISKFCFA